MDDLTSQDERSSRRKGAVHFSLLARDLIKVGLRQLLLFALMLVSSFDALAAEKDPSAELTFTAQCPRLYAQADKFAQECLANARENTRYFSPGGAGRLIPETRSVYFRPAAPGSHFALGCMVTLGKIRFLGVYYSTNGENFKEANTSPIRFTDAQGNVGIMVNENPVNLLAIRQFGSDAIPLRFDDSWKDHAWIKNCEPSASASGEIFDENGRFWYSEIRKDGVYTVTDCNGPKGQQSCWTHDYVEFFSSLHRDVIYHGDVFFQIFIRDGGDILVKKDLHDQACALPVVKNRAAGAYIELEMCSKYSSSIGR